LSNFTYDKNGNIIKDTDPVTNQARQFVFNGDNKQTEVKDANGNAIGKYYYDGEGKRVKKVTATETTIFVYSGGKLVAEYSTQVSQNPTVSYTTTDHLGSPRVITDKTGNIKSRRDFMPFGEDILAGIGGRTGDTGQRYSSSADDIRQKFTGYQKDSETNLDFAEARMYANRYGRFTAVDPLIASGKSANPQTFNRYSYTSNNPVIRVDRNGEDWIIEESQVKVKGKYITVRMPVWVNPADVPKIAETVSGVWAIGSPFGGGFQALYSSRPEASQLFATREEAQAQYNKWCETAAIHDLATNGVQKATDTTNGTLKGIGNFGIGAWNEGSQPLGMFGSRFGVPNPFAIQRFTANNDTEATYMSAGEIGPTVGTFFAGSVFSATRAPSVFIRESTSGMSRVQLNGISGNAFRDEIAGALTQEGRQVTTEVYKRTPFGKRFIDIEVSHNGQVLGGIETKFGGARYGSSQRAKDFWLRYADNYIVNVVRSQ
jgi:RHS repeat-associated protein